MIRLRGLDWATGGMGGGGGEHGWGGGKHGLSDGGHDWSGGGMKGVVEGMEAMLLRAKFIVLPFYSSTVSSFHDQIFVHFET